MNPPTSIILEADSLTWRYPGQQSPLFEKLCFRLPRGALCMILGANGAGKSTLLNILTGRTPCQQGRVMCTTAVGFVPQKAPIMMPVSVEEVVLSGRSAHIPLFSQPGETDRMRCDKALRQVGLEGYQGRRFLTLSGGEQQLVLLARAMASGARLLLLDEITAAMDWQNQAVTLRLIDQLAKCGYTLLFTTHSPQHAFDFASHCLLLWPGGDWTFGPAKTVLTAASLSRLYGLPVEVWPSGGPNCSTGAIPQFLQLQGTTML